MSELKQYLDKFKNDIANKKMQASQERREKTIELQEAVDKTKLQEVQNQCLEKSLEIRGEEEEKEVDQLIQQETTSREKKELDKKKKEISKSLD